MNKRYLIIAACVLVALFCLIAALFVLFSAINSQALAGMIQFLGVLGFIVVIAGIAVLAQLHDEGDKTYGDAHFADLREMREGEFTTQERGRLILGTAHRQIIAIPETRQREHILLIATTGGGKSTGIIIPGLLQETGERGIFVNDMKGELYQLTAGAISRYMPASIFAPSRPDAASVYYNPLDQVREQEDAEDLAQCWVDNTGISQEQYYNDVARLLITAAVLHIVDCEPGAPFSRLADMLSSTEFDQLRQILTKSKSQRAKDVGAAFINSIGEDAKSAASVMTGMQTRFLVMKSARIRHITQTHPDEHRNISFKRLAEGPEALFMCVPASDTRRLKPLTALLSMQLMNSLTRRSDNKPFVLYMDELANIGRVPHYEEHISLVRGQGIALIQAIQNFAQLEATYEQAGARTIIANSTTKIFYPGAGKPECEYCSELLGTTTVPLKGTSISEDKETFSESVTRRPLLLPEEVRQLKRGLLVVVSGNRPPMLIENIPYYKRPELIALASLPVQEIPPAIQSQPRTPLLPTTIEQQPPAQQWPTP